MSTVLNNQNTELVITLNAPYTNIQRILSYEDILETNISVYYGIDKFLRYSFNNINYSNWVALTNENLQFINIPQYSDFWIEYKYILNDIEEDESVEFKTIALEVLTHQQKILKKDCDIKSITDDCCVDQTQTSIDDCCPQDMFNPYDISNAIKVYEPLVKLTSNMFGFEVEYYHTNPRLNSKDVILKEYSVYNVESKCAIKVLIPDNTLPTKELQFNSQEGIILPDVFEVHLVKSVFEDAFGEGKIPRYQDYLYFPYLKRVYKVNSVMIADENPFNTANYYRVNLVDYAQQINIIDEEGVSDDLKELTNSYEDVFGGEMKEEIDKVIKPEQYETLNKDVDGKDIIRLSIDPFVIIRDHNITNPNTFQVISTNYYDFTNIEIVNQDAVIYNYSKGLPDDFAFTYMINPQKSLTIQTLNVNIKRIEDTTGTYSNDYYNNGILIETSEAHLLQEGDIFYIRNSSYYNGINLVAKIISDTKIIVDKIFKGYNGGAITKIYEKQIIINNINILSVILINGNTILKIYEKILIFPYSLPLNKWSYNVLNFSNSFKQVALYVYDNVLNSIYNKVNLIDPVDFDPKPISLKSGSYYLTNLRLFNATIEEEQHISVLSQQIVIDSHLALITDNALPQIRLKKYKNNR